MIRIGTCGTGGQLPPFICDSILDFNWNPNPACANQQMNFWAVPFNPGLILMPGILGILQLHFNTPTQHIYPNPGIYNVYLTRFL